MDDIIVLFAEWYDYNLPALSSHHGLKDWDAKTLNMMGLEAFRWGYEGHPHLIDRDGPVFGIWDFVYDCHRAGYDAYDASRNEWDWNPKG